MILKANDKNRNINIVVCVCACDVLIMMDNQNLLYQKLVIRIEI